MTQVQIEVIRALADNNMNITQTGKKIYMHRNSIDYHIKKIHSETGKNPVNFYDLCDLLAIVGKSNGKG